MSIGMYALWTASIVSLLATTFTNFQHVDLNCITLFLLSFALINSFLAMNKSKDPM